MNEIISLTEGLYRRMVADIGRGFHPETRGEEYDSLPPGYTPKLYDNIVDAAYAAALDVFGIAEDELNKEEVK